MTTLPETRFERLGPYQRHVVGAACWIGAWTTINFMLWLLFDRNSQGVFLRHAAIESVLAGLFIGAASWIITFGQLLYCQSHNQAVLLTYLGVVPSYIILEAFSYLAYYGDLKRLDVGCSLIGGAPVAFVVGGIWRQATKYPYRDPPERIIPDSSSTDK